MSKKDNSAEKRKPKRFKAKKGAFATVNSDYNKIGQIKTIGKGGLTFHYVAAGERCSGPVEVEIFSTDRDFYLKRLSAEVVLDSEVEDTVKLSSLPVRQLEVQFGKMNPKQKLLLGHFIKKYTIK